jgi:hypothetical protein
MMPPERKDRRREQCRLGGEGRTNQAESREEERNHGGGQDLEEALTRFQVPLRIL